MAAGDAPGLDLVIYGCVLILVVAVAPRGIAGFLEALSWPGNSALKTRVNALMSRPPRLSGRSASIIEVAGTSPATTPEGDSNRPETSVGRGPTALERSDG